MRQARLLTGSGVVRRMGAILFIAVVVCCTRAEAACVYPIVSTFGVADSFTPPSDPIPYAPTAFPQFVTYLNNNGVPTSSMTNFDETKPNRWAVATLRHGLRSCFPGATSLKLCFDAYALADLPYNDTVTIYDTDFSTYNFPNIYWNSIAALVGSWNAGMTATVCIDLTQQMLSNQIGDMLQFAVQDDTVVDYITMILQ